MRRGLSYHNRRSSGGYNPFSQLGPTLDLTFAGNVTNLLDPNGFTLDTNFIAPQYLIGAQYTIWETGMGLVSKIFSDIITFTRTGTNATYFNSAGVLTSAGADVPRFDYNPSTLAARGLLIEEQRTNSIRNNTMQGAVAGTPGTLPTNWALGGVTTGLTISVVGTGTESGITYIDIRFNGTAGAALNPNILFDTSTGIAAANGQTWAWSSYVSLVGGSLTNVTGIIAVQSMFSSVPTLLGTLSGSPFVPTGAALNTQRQTFVGTLNQATTAFVRPQLQFSVANGAAIDITLRIGLPQLEQGAFATSVIPTTTTALTRNADQASVNTLSPWYNASASTLYTEFNTPVPTTVSASAVTAGYDDGTANNRFSNFYTSNTGAVAANQTTGGTPNYTIVAASGLTLSNIQKQATRFQAGSYASSANGSAAVTDPFASAPPTVNTLRFGLRPSGTQANMWLRRVTVYPRGLSNAELQAITA